MNIGAIGGILNALGSVRRSARRRRWSEWWRFGSRATDEKRYACCYRCRNCSSLFNVSFPHGVKIVRMLPHCPMCGVGPIHECGSSFELYWTYRYEDLREDEQ